MKKTSNDITKANYGEDVVNRLRELRYEYGYRVSDIIKETGMSRLTITKILFDSDDTCECCGAKIRNKTAGYKSLACGVKCASLMRVYFQQLRAYHRGEVYDRPVKPTSKKIPTSGESEIIGYDDLFDFPIYKEPESMKRLKKIISDADASGKSYGHYVADEDHRKAKELGYFSLSTMDDSFQRYIDDVHTEMRRSHNLNREEVLKDCLK